MSSNIVLQLVYFSFGTKDVLEQECSALQERIDVYLDGKKVDLPSMEVVGVLNICLGVHGSAHGH